MNDRAVRKVSVQPGRLQLATSVQACSRCESMRCRPWHGRHNRSLNDEAVRKHAHVIHATGRPEAAGAGTRAQAVGTFLFVCADNTLVRQFSISFWSCPFFCRQVHMSLPAHRRPSMQLFTRVFVRHQQMISQRIARIWFQPELPHCS
jgi:hypothetical protein